MLTIGHRKYGTFLTKPVSTMYGYSLNLLTMITLSRYSKTDYETSILPTGMSV